jgi:hypothetical protein
MKDSKGTIKVKLSASGIANIPMQNDFIFIIGKSHYRCPSFVADFLWPKLARLPAIDPAIDRSIISASDCYCDFDSFLSLGCGSDISVSSSNRDFIVLLSSELGDRELLFLILTSRLNETEITRENVFQRFSDLRLLDSDFDFDVSREVAVVASYFHEFSKSEPSGLSFPILSEVISSSDDQLYETVWSIIARDRSDFNFFRLFASSICLLRQSVALLNLYLHSLIYSIHRFGRV